MTRDQLLIQELKLDPAQKGYAPHVAKGDCSTVAALLSAKTETITTKRLSVEEIADCIDGDDLALFTLEGLFYLRGGYSLSFADVAKVFPGGSKSWTRLQAVANRAGSRAEVVLGEGAVASLDELGALMGASK